MGGPRGLGWIAASVVGASVLLQAVALVVHPDLLTRSRASHHVFSTIELALVAVLIGVGVGYRRWAAQTDQPPLVRFAATAALVSLCLCALGDVVNRNYPGDAYQWDHVLRASFLITSIWFFLPGYAVIAWANRRVTAQRVSGRFAALTVAASLLAGLALAVGTPHPGMARSSALMITLYTMTLAVLGGSTIWLVRAYGWRRSRVVVVGCWLALVADALIGHFWISTDHYPTVEHVNWVVYVASLAMIQRLPLLVADGTTA